MSKLQKKKFPSLNGVPWDQHEPELIPLYKLIAGDKMVLIRHSERDSLGLLRSSYRPTPQSICLIKEKMVNNGIRT